MYRRETTGAREAREKEYEEDARRLRELAAFAKFSDDDLKDRPSSTSDLDVRTMAADS